MAKSATLDRLYGWLKTQASDAQIKAGLQLSPSGQQKIAAALGIAPQHVAALIDSLVSKLRQEDSRRLVDTYESAVADDRFTFEPDSTGSVTVRDSHTGKSCFLQADKGAQLLARLRRPGCNVQAVLARYEPMMDLTEDTLMTRDAPSEPRSFQAEITSDAPRTYNFEWKIDGQQGSGTASFWSGKDGAFNLKIVQARDRAGNPMRPDPAMTKKLEAAARAFIAQV